MRTGECLHFAWETFKRQASALVVTTLVLFIAHCAIQLAFTVVLKRFGGIGSMLVSGLFWGGYMAVARKAARGETPTLEDAFSPLKQRPGDFIIVGIATYAGILACFVGMFVTSFLFLFAPLCVLEGADYKQALSRSKDLMLQNAAESVVFYLVLLVVNVAGALALGVGLLVSAPVTALAIVKANELASVPAALPPSVPGPA